MKLLYKIKTFKEYLWTSSDLLTCFELLRKAEKYIKSLGEHNFNSGEIADRLYHDISDEHKLRATRAQIEDTLISGIDFYHKVMRYLK